MKGPIRLERLGAHIDEFIKACRGMICYHSQALEDIIPGTIGAVDKDQVIAITTIPGYENGFQNGHKIDIVESVINPPISLGEVIGANGGNSKDDGKHPRRRLVRRSSSKNLSLALQRADDDESVQSGRLHTHDSLADHGFFSKAVLTGIIRTNSNGVDIYRAQVQNTNDEHDPEPFAIKIAQCRMDCDLEILKELNREGKVAKRLDHPNICKFLDMIATPE